MESLNQDAANSSRPNRTLVVMAKAPKPGMVKTRLTVSLPSNAVTALYCCLLQDTIALATSLTDVEVAVMCPESDQDELAHLLGNTVEVVAQKGAGLAAGLTSVFRHFTAGGRQHVIAFNSDSPHLAPSVLDSAFEILVMHASGCGSAVPLGGGSTRRLSRRHLDEKERSPEGLGRRLPGPWQRHFSAHRLSILGICYGCYRS